MTTSIHVAVWVLVGLTVAMAVVTVWFALESWVARLRARWRMRRLQARVWWWRQHINERERT